MAGGFPMSYDERTARRWPAGSSGAWTSSRRRRVGPVPKAGRLRIYAFPRMAPDSRGPIVLDAYGDPGRSLGEVPGVVSIEVPIGSVESVVMVRSQEDAGRAVGIVGGQSDRGLYRVTASDPLGRALLGWAAGGEVQLLTDSGVVRFTVLSVN